VNHNVECIFNFNLLENCSYVYDVAYYLQENSLSGKIKIKKPMMLIEHPLPEFFMGYELLWV